DARPPSPSRHAPPASRLLELDGPADGDHAQSNERYGDPRRPPECGDSNPHSFGVLRFTSADRHQRPGRVQLAAHSFATAPPSTSRIAPVTDDASSDARN